MGAYLNGMYLFLICNLIYISFIKIKYVNYLHITNKYLANLYIKGAYMSKVENQDSGMKRGLKDRHISMIAMGGCIGTGLFMTSWCYSRCRCIRCAYCICNYWSYGILFNDFFRRNGYVFTCFVFI